MIELLSELRCVSCNQCVNVCPTNVFESTASGIPIIARQSDCQTCFMCELYCPADALYVAPDSESSMPVAEAALAQQGLLGGYREVVGWGPGRKPVAGHEMIYQLSVKTRI